MSDWNTDQLECYELWDDTTPHIPPRSRFYRLEPIGVGTLYVESLSSYFVRLANAHCLQPKRLASQEILPLTRDSDQLPLSADNFNSWFHGSATVNGATIFTSRWIYALEQLTGQSNLHFLTMLIWNNVVHRRGLVRKTRTWCPNCYKEWQENGQIIYEPLMWCLSSVTTCPLHKQQLSQLCPNRDCHKPIPLFADWSQLGYCPHCGCFLGFKGVVESKKIDSNEINATWINTCVGELLAVAPKLTTIPTINDLALKISLILRVRAKGNNVALAKKLGISASNLIGWQQGLHTMSFDVLLKLCYQLDLSPAQLLMSVEDSKKHGNWFLFEYDNIYIDTKEVKEALSAYLEVSIPPTSLKLVAKHLGYPPGFLQYHYPNLCTAITKKYAARQKKTKPIERVTLQQELEYILMRNGPLPPLMEIAKHLNCTTATLQRYFPHLCKEILERRRLSAIKTNVRVNMDLPVKEALHFKGTNDLEIKYQQSTVNAKERNNLNWQEKVLHEALLSDEHLPLKAIAKKLGCHCKVLRKRFPELCRLVEEHYENSFDLDQIEKTLEKALKHNAIPLSISQIAKSLGYSENILKRYYPELCSEIFRRRLLKFDTNYLKATLEALLTGEEPISMSEVGRRLGYSSSTLRNHFSSLCLAISSRYQNFRRQRKQERVEKLCLAVQEATIVIHNQGKHPTSTLVSSMIGGGVHFRIPEVRYAWHKKMKELGYEK